MENLLSHKTRVGKGDDVRAMIVYITRLSLVSIGVVIPLTLCLPGNVCTHAAGNVKMISDGFRAHSSLSTVVWGSALCWVTALRVLVLLSPGTQEAYGKTVAQLALVLSTPAAFVTIRYDDVESVHIWAAAVWIVGSLFFHYAVLRSMSDSFHALLKWVLFGGTVVCGIVFLMFFAVVNSDPLLSNPTMLSVVAVLEILTVYGIGLCDFLLTSYILYEENKGVGIWEILYERNLTVIASILSLAAMWVFVFVVILFYFLSLDMPVV